MTPAERAARTERLKAERVAAGKSPTINDPAFYRILDAVLATAARPEEADRVAS